MTKPLRIRVHCLDHGRAALAAARAAGRPVALESPRGAALAHGIGWWRALVDSLAAEFPDVLAEAVLDCADAPGAALAALRAGLAAVRVEAPEPARRRLAAVAEQVGGWVGETAEDGGVLDLLGAADPQGTTRDRLHAVATGERARHGGE